jgi:protocatechuate 3,4-dioxygenase beta subunit
MSSYRKCAAVVLLGMFQLGFVSAQPGGSHPAASQDQPASKQKDDHKSERSTVKLKILVTSPDGKPVSNASVYVRFNESGGLFHHDKLAELDLKTNEDGSVRVPPVPQGKIMVQVIAPGWHTFGKWYDVEKDEESIAIKLQPPPHWY